MMRRICKKLHKRFMKARLEAVGHDIHSIRILEKERELKGAHIDEL